MAACLFLGCWGIHLHFTKSSWAIGCEFRWALSAIFSVSLLSWLHKISPFSLSSLNSTTLCFHSLCGWCLPKPSFTPCSEIWINICCVNYASDRKAFFRSCYGGSELQLSRSNEKRLHGDYEGCPHSCFSQLPNTCSQHRLAKTKAKLRHNIHFYYKLNKLVSAV